MDGEDDWTQYLGKLKGPLMCIKNKNVVGYSDASLGMASSTEWV